MPTRNVVLTDSQAKFVEQMVASGQYQNASEVLREGLRLVQAREAEQAAKLAALREAVEREDVSEINTARDALATAMHPIAQKVYAQAQSEPGAADDSGPGAPADTDTSGPTVDADFSEADKN